MKWTETIKMEELLKAALEFYERSPDGQYDNVAVAAIRYAMLMKPWNGFDWTLPAGVDK